jgi:hypothetical protein
MICEFICELSFNNIIFYSGLCKSEIISLNEIKKDLNGFGKGLIPLQSLKINFLLVNEENILNGLNEKLNINDFPIIGYTEEFINNENNNYSKITYFKEIKCILYFNSKILNEKIIIHESILKNDLPINYLYGFQRYIYALNIKKIRKSCIIFCFYLDFNLFRKAFNLCCDLNDFIDYKMIK